MADTSVTLNQEESRYEIRVDGQLAGFTQAIERDGVLVFPHTEIDKAYAGQGLGSTLVREALDDVRSRGRTIVPLCPFVAKFINENPEYADLVAEGRGA